MSLRVLAIGRLRIEPPLILAPMAGVTTPAMRILCERFGAGEKIHAIGHAVADEKIGDGRDAEVSENLDQCIDLVFLAHSAQFQKGKACVHGQHHDGAKQDK